MNRLSIHGDGGRVDIDVVEYERPNVTEGSDANWLLCNVKVQAGPFNGHYDASISTQDFVYFARDLERLNKTCDGEALFDPEEGAISLKLLGNGRGHVSVEARAMIVSTPRVLVELKMLSDQSYIPELLQSVRAVLRVFPERGSRTTFATGSSPGGEVP